MTASTNDRKHNPAAALAEALPGLATVGRRRSDKPPCCEDPSEPPVMNDALRALISAC